MNMKLELSFGKHGIEIDSPKDRFGSKHVIRFANEARPAVIISGQSRTDLGYSIRRLINDLEKALDVLKADS